MFEITTEITTLVKTIILKLSNKEIHISIWNSKIQEIGLTIFKNNESISLISLNVEEIQQIISVLNYSIKNNFYDEFKKELDNALKNIESIESCSEGIQKKYDEICNKKELKKEVD